MFKQAIAALALAALAACGGGGDAYTWQEEPAAAPTQPATPDKCIAILDAATGCKK